MNEGCDSGVQEEQDENENKDDENEDDETTNAR